MLQSYIDWLIYYKTQTTDVVFKIDLDQEC